MSDSNGPNFWTEEFNRFFGYSKDEPKGVKDWKISTLGPTRVGKTVLISGLYAQFYLGTEHGKSIGIESIGTDLHDMLQSVAKGLRLRPAFLPDRTTEIQNAKLKFLIEGENRRYQKVFTLQDHAGEHLMRGNPGHFDTMENLKSSDTFMVFIDSRDVLREDYQEASEEMELEVIRGLIRDLSAGLHEGDLIPISVVFSKADLVAGKEPEVISKGVNLFSSLSEELPNCVFCFSTASVVRPIHPDKPSDFIFSPKKIEVPFLFSISGIVVRNANFLRMAANEVQEERDMLKSEGVSGGGFLERMFARIRKGMEVRRLDSKSKRYVALSAYDLELATCAMNAVKLHKNVTFMLGGVVYDDVQDVFPELI